MPKKLWQIQFPGDLASSFLDKAGRKLNSPLVCWRVDSSDKVSKVEVVMFRGSCDYYKTRVDYAETTDGSVVSSFYLFSQKPVLVKIKDKYGVCRQWIAGTKKDIEKIRVQD